MDSFRFQHRWIISRAPILVMLCTLAVWNIVAQTLIPADDQMSTKGLVMPGESNFHLGISERGGILASRVQNLYFSQFINAIDAELEFRVFEPLWMGLGLGYTATLPSKISEETILIRPGWDSFHGALFLQLITPYTNGGFFDGWVARASLEAWYQKISNVELYQFFLGTEVGIGRQFTMGSFTLEPDLRLGFAFPRDARGNTATSLTLGLRFLYQVAP